MEEITIIAAVSPVRKSTFKNIVSPGQHIRPGFCVQSSPNEALLIVWAWLNCHIILHTWTLIPHNRSPCVCVWRWADVWIWSVICEAVFNAGGSGNRLNYNSALRGAVWHTDMHEAWWPQIHTSHTYKKTHTHKLHQISANGRQTAPKLI